jgi:hypothetical protein
MKPGYGRLALLSVVISALQAQSFDYNCTGFVEFLDRKKDVKDTVSSFLQDYYKQDAWVSRARNSADLLALAQLDPWLSSLQDPDSFLEQLWPNIVDDVDDVATFKTSEGVSTSSPKCSAWPECSSDFYNQGHSVVVRRENLGFPGDLPSNLLEQDLMTTFHLPSITAHAYISAGSAQALMPHTDP